MWPSLSVLPTGGSFLCWVVIRNTSKPHHLWGWFLGFIIMVLKKIKGWILMYNHGCSQMYWNKSNNHLQNPLSPLWKPLILWGFWKNQNWWLLSVKLTKKLEQALCLKKGACPWTTVWVQAAAPKKVDANKSFWDKPLYLDVQSHPQ
jgi:hypothetical protein